MPDLQPSSPLPVNMQRYTAPDLQLRELERVSKLRVQALRSTEACAAQADPKYLPESPNTACGTDPFALWIAPDDWLVYSLTDTVTALGDAMALVESRLPLVTTDVTSASVVLELSGPRSIDVLMRDCTLDLDGEAIRMNCCARTLFAQTTVLIHRPEAFTWRLFVERSVARHVWDWLVDTAGEPLA